MPELRIWLLISMKFWSTNAKNVPTAMASAPFSKASMKWAVLPMPQLCMMGKLV